MTGLTNFQKKQGISKILDEKTIVNAVSLMTHGYDWSNFSAKPILVLSSMDLCRFLLIWLMTGITNFQKNKTY